MSEMDLRLDLMVQGVNVVTTTHQGKSAGMTCAWASQVSKEMAMVCLGWQSATREMIENAGMFSINVLRREQIGLARHFGTGTSASTNKFEGIATVTGETGLVLLAEAPVSLECKVHATYDPDPNELMIVGKIVAVHRRLGRFEPLIFKQEDY